MTDELHNILRPERTIGDDDAHTLLQYAVNSHPDAWHAYLFIRQRYGVGDACTYLSGLADDRLRRLAVVMPRLESEVEEREHPCPRPVVAPEANTVNITTSGGQIFNTPLDPNMLSYLTEQRNTAI